ncbi:UNVERIFIED_CONTAM: protein PIN-LIKES 1 [Sesamum angustifolium]|uniref:Protein PIN-LIKES 1 n=1 Tax=Sesamum angustifolium TaxID=2727405 RepID=A0AAW2L7K4_9LAMI
MNLLDLFRASSIPVLKVLLVTGLGSYLARDRVDILGDDARKHLNNIVFFVFSPALVSSNLAKTITYDSMVKLWFMPINILLTFIIGTILGWGVIQITRTPPHLRGLVTGCCAAGNLGNLLLIIIPAVCKERASPFGNADVCYEHGMAYASLSMAIGAIYLWSYVYNIVRVSSSKSSNEVKASDLSVRAEDCESGLAQPQEKIENEPYQMNKTEPNERNAEQMDEAIRGSTVKVSGSDKIKQRLETLFKQMNLKRLFAPSTIGACPRKLVLLLDLWLDLNLKFGKLMIGDAAPLRVIQDTALLLGDGAIPAVTLVMGGNLLKGLKGSGIQKSIIFGILIVRYVALPLIGIGVVKGAQKLGLVHDNPLYRFVLLLQFSLPPAMNIGTLKLTVLSCLFL